MAKQVGFSLLWLYLYFKTVKRIRFDYVSFLQKHFATHSKIKKHMKLPFHDKKFRFLTFSVVIVIALEVLSLLGIQIPMPYAPFIYAAFILAIGYEVLWDGLKSAVRFNFGSINLLMLIAVIGAFYLREYPEAAVVIVLYVLGEKLEDIGI